MVNNRVMTQQTHEHEVQDEGFEAAREAFDDVTLPCGAGLYCKTDGTPTYVSVSVYATLDGQWRRDPNDNALLQREIEVLTGRRIRPLSNCNWIAAENDEAMQVLYLVDEEAQTV